MGSSSFGELGLGRSSSSTSGRSSTRKGKKNSSDKPKQPQRGLGVAQLEKIRLQSQMAASYNIPYHHHHQQSPPFINTLNKEEDQVMGLQMGYSSPSPPSSSTVYAVSSSSSSSLFGLHPNTMMEFGDAGRLDSMCDGFHSSLTARSSSVYQSHNFSQHAVTLPLFEQTMEDSGQKKRRHDHRRRSTGSVSQNSENSSDTQEELDLELRLSL